MSSGEQEGSTQEVPPRPVNGVFQGGGAKSIANVGALQAFRRRGLWFGSVAGSSAGAITASLIAADISVEDLATVIPEALDTLDTPVAGRLGLAVLGRATAVYQSDGLRTWLNTRLAQEIEAPANRPVTFRQLHQSSKIELYVLAVDLATKLPVVFSRRTTPDVEVAAAVVASCAIPGAFPSGRAVFSSGDGARVHQLIDGSGWATYPSFIFQDRGFRTWLRAEWEADGPQSDAEQVRWAKEADRPVVGFVFVEPEPAEQDPAGLVIVEPEPAEQRDPIGFVPLDGPAVDPHFDLGPTYTSGKRVPYLIGATLSSDWARLMIGLALVVWATIAVATLPVGIRRYSTWMAEWAPDFLFPLLLVASLTIAVLAIVVAVAAIALLLLASRLLADTMLPAFSAVSGAALELPPWVGLGDDSVVIRVPDGELKTVNFTVSRDVRKLAVTCSETSVGAQLDDPAFQQRLEALFAGETPPKTDYQRGDPVVDTPSQQTTTPVATLLVIIASATAICGLAWWVTTSAGSADIVQIMIALGVAVVGVVAASLYLGKRSGDRAHRRAKTDATAGSLRPHVPPPILWTGGAVLLVAGATLSFLAMDDRSESTVEAQVVVAEVTGSNNNRYELTVDGRDGTIDLISERHLRLGEQVFVDADDTPGGYTLAGPLDDVRFGMSVVLWALGFGALASAERSRRWIQRCQRLDEVVTAWKQD